jgi:MFS superfamily sulfate permease-like transporter
MTSIRYSASDFPGDLFAGLTLWAVFAAQALAYSRLAHATPVAGLVTAVAGALIYAALGSSRRISIGPAGGICAIVGASVASVPPERLAESLAALTVMTAGFLFIAGLLRVSFLQRLFPTPVFVGYLAGTGLTILVGQIRELTAAGMLALAVGVAAIAAVLAL